jgi:UDP-2,3-diacylglucosamine pyrophosphatase LpxH
MLAHETLEAALRGAFGGELTLVARYADDALGLRLPRAYVFIPDCHILRPEDTAVFPHSCCRLEDAIETLLETLLELRRAHAELRVFQVGDVVDEWRSKQAGGQAERIQGIFAGRPRLFDLLTQSFPGGLGAEVLAGNHDYALHRLPDRPRARFKLLGEPPDGQVLVLHGDVFDWIEALPEALKSAAVRVARWVRPGVIDLNGDLAREQDQAVREVNARLPADDTPIGRDGAVLAADEPLAGANGGGAAAVNVIDGERNPRTQFFRSALEVAKELRGSDLNVRMVVMGHTHHARIVRAQLAGGPFVLADCGAWYGSCILPGEHQPVLSAQLGVLIGNDMRIYHVGRRAA